MEKILIIEDEDRILMGLEDDLRFEGYDVASAKDGLQGLTMAKEKAYDLIILDLMLPKLNGFEVCKQLRQAGIATPILMLTAKSQEVDKVLGLELGADDYVTKPFSPRELLARVKALLRRTQSNLSTSALFHFGDFEIDFKKYEARKSGRQFHLTALEFDLLRLFIQHPNEVLSRDFILDKIWGEEVYVNNRTVDTHVAQLRKKIEDDPANPKYIVGVRGVGYKFVPTI
ncbi:response regulator transcription factor [candidate division KSB1 bacterium]|nr:response regulator transcription factor [candidate division KSB1 bacterium]